MPGPHQRDAVPEQVGPYRLVRSLGLGATGSVWEARHADEPERPLALKLIALTDLDRLRRVRREVESLRLLQHPHIVRLLDVGELGDTPYLVTELVEGETLEARLRQGPLPEREAARLVAALAGAIEHAHGLGIMHRDLKPANVILDREDQPKLLDFGLAAPTGVDSSSLTRSGMLLGTPGFFAPEQAAGERSAQGPATDVYGLGALLYACLTGVGPNQGETLQELMASVLRADVAPPRELRPGLDRKLEAICLRCLKRDPARRYLSAGRLAGALREWLDPSPRPRPARGLALALVVASVGGALAASRSRSDEPRASPTAAARDLAETSREWVLQPGALEGCDTFVRSFGYYVNDNYGCEPYLIVGWRPLQNDQEGPVRALIRFDLSRLPPGSVVEEATLELYPWKEGSASRLAAWCVAESGGGRTPWVEGSSSSDATLDGVAWLGDYVEPGRLAWDSDLPHLDRPDRLESLALGSALAPASDWVALDVTEAVRRWHEGALPNHGLFVLGDESQPERDTRRIFHSSDSPQAARRPRLRLRYRGGPLRPELDEAAERERLMEEVRQEAPEVDGPLSDWEFAQLVALCGRAPFFELGFFRRGLYWLALGQGDFALRELRLGRTREVRAVPQAEFEERVRQALELVRLGRPDQLDYQLELLREVGCDFPWLTEFETD